MNAGDQITVADFAALAAAGNAKLAPAVPFDFELVNRNWLTELNRLRNEVWRKVFTTGHGVDGGSIQKSPVTVDLRVSGPWVVNVGSNLWDYKGNSAVSSGAYVEEIQEWIYDFGGFQVNYYMVPSMPWYKNVEAWFPGTDGAGVTLYSGLIFGSRDFRFIVPYTGTADNYQLDFTASADGQLILTMAWPLVYTGAGAEPDVPPAVGDIGMTESGWLWTHGGEPVGGDAHDYGITWTVETRDGRGKYGLPPYSMNRWNVDVFTPRYRVTPKFELRASISQAVTAGKNRIHVVLTAPSGWAFMDPGYGWPSAGAQFFEMELFYGLANTAAQVDAVGLHPVQGIKKIVAADFDATQTLVVTTAGVDNFGTSMPWNSLVRQTAYPMKGWQLSDADLQACWVATTIPPPAVNVFLDMDLPQYLPDVADRFDLYNACHTSSQFIAHAQYSANEEYLTTSMRKPVPDPPDADIATMTPGIKSRPARWPVIRDTDAETLTYFPKDVNGWSLSEAFSYDLWQARHGQPSPEETDYNRDNIYSPTGDSSADAPTKLIPTIGYCIFDIVVRRMPVGDPAVAPSTGTADLIVNLGVMRLGVFVQMGTVTILAGNAGAHLPVFWPVFEGCSVAYQCAEQLVVTAAVNWQPIFFNQGFQRQANDATAFASPLPQWWSDALRFANLFYPVPISEGYPATIPEVVQYHITTNPPAEGDVVSFANRFQYPMATAVYNDLMAVLALL